MSDREAHLELLLSEGLDLCVRAREMDAMDRRQATLGISSCPDEWVEGGLFEKHVKAHNQFRPDAPISTRSATVAIWLQDQYDRDLASWERKARNYLLHGIAPSPSSGQR